MQILIYGMVYSVINLLKQAQGTDFHSVPPNNNVHPLTTFPHSKQHCPPHQNEIPQMISTREYNTPGRQNICIETALEYTWTTK